VARYRLNAVPVGTESNLKRGDDLTLGSYHFRLLRSRDRVLVGYDDEEDVHLALFTSEYLRVEKYWDKDNDTPLTAALTYLFGAPCKEGDMVAFAKNQKWRVIQCCGER
jgi:hypothetical protein